MTTATTFAELLDLSTQPIAIAFRESAPDGMSQVDSAAAAGCTYWRYAAEGRTFYTEASDHFGCPIGSHTHGIDLPAETAKELQGLIGTMVELEYLNMQEVPSIPRREGPFGVAMYAPLSDAEFEPDVVLVAGTAKQMMILAEAAHAAGVDCETSMVGRPTCAVIPAVMKSGKSATNLGCIGNRIYTGIGDEHLYFALAGRQLDSVLEKLKTIVNANRELEKFHLDRVS